MRKRVSWNNIMLFKLIKIYLSVCKTGVLIRVQVAKVTLMHIIRRFHSCVLQRKTHRLSREDRAFRNSLHHEGVVVLKIYRKFIRVQDFSNSTERPQTRRRSHWRSDDIVDEVLEERFLNLGGVCDARENMAVQNYTVKKWR
jgi:hypothetical protein